MGSIAELLGYSLQGTDLTKTEDPAPGGGPSSDVVDERAERAREIAMDAVLGETDLDPSDARAELSLSGDLDLDTIALYAIVAAIEHELRLAIPDDTVTSWQTLGDVLDAVAHFATTQNS